MYKIGVIGCGAIAGMHIKAILASKEYTLVAVADINPEQLAKVKDKYGIQNVYTDYKALLNKEDLDVIVVSTHVPTHAEITIAALNKGINVICEKPMAVTVKDSESMIRAAEKNNRLLTINFNTRSSPRFLKVKEYIDSGVLGKIRVVRIVFNWSAHQWTPPERFHNFMLNGGPIIDSAVHFFDGVRWYTGQEFDRIDANGVFFDDYENPKHGIISCKMKDGSIALIEAGWLYTKTTKDQSSFYQITVIGDEGTVEHDNVSNKLRLFTENKTEETVYNNIEKHIEVLYEQFANSLKAGKLLNLATGHDGMKAAEAAYKALVSSKRSSKELVTI
jgi:predicted dehydrogenase